MDRGCRCSTISWEISDKPDLTRRSSIGVKSARRHCVAESRARRLIRMTTALKTPCRNSQAAKASCETPPNRTNSHSFGTSLVSLGVPEPDEGGARSWSLAVQTHTQNQRLRHQRRLRRSSQRYGKRVPIVVAGDKEYKPESAARVAWAGAGINLGTGRPKPEAIRDAVREVIGNPR